MSESTLIPEFLLDFEALWKEPHAAEYFRAALTRRAWLQEHGSGSRHHHEPLEWLGDRMLEAVVAKELWKRFPFEDPKRLDAGREALCSEPLLTRIGHDLGLLPLILKGRGEALQQQVKAGKGLSDHVEAVLGAAFLAGGMAGVEALVHRWWAPHWPGHLDEVQGPHPSSELNVLVTRIWRQSLSKESWQIEGVGPFQATVTLPDGTPFSGEPQTTKQVAKASAASATLPYLRELDVRPGG